MNSTAPADFTASADSALMGDLWDVAPVNTLTITTVGRTDGSAALYLTGTLDVATAPLLGTAVESVVATGRHDLRLDVGRLSFCDCAGLSAVLAARRSADAAGGNATLCSVTPRLRKLIRLLQLDILLEDPHTAAG